MDAFDAEVNHYKLGNIFKIVSKIVFFLNRSTNSEIKKSITRVPGFAKPGVLPSALQASDANSRISEQGFCNGVLSPKLPNAVRYPGRITSCSGSGQVCDGPDTGTEQKNLLARNYDLYAFAKH